MRWCARLTEGFELRVIAGALIVCTDTGSMRPSAGAAGVERSGMTARGGRSGDADPVDQGLPVLAAHAVVAAQAQAGRVGPVILATNAAIGHCDVRLTSV